MTKERMHALVNDLAAEKSKQNIEAALEIYHQDIELVAPSIESVNRGREEVRKGLKAFFQLLPDYHVELNQYAYNDDLMFASGFVRATPNTKNNTASQFEIPVFIEFYFRDDAISKEVFFLDMGLAFRKAGVQPEDLAPFAA